MAIGIMSAMREEIEAIFSVLKEPNREVHGMRTYYSGDLFGSAVVLVFSRWGKVAAATTATHLINHFPIEEIIFTGVAGAADMNLQIGDIIIGQDLYQHDLDASPMVDQLVVPLLNKKSFSTDASCQTRMTKACHSFLSHRSSYVTEEVLQSFQISSSKSHVGDIASGDQFISSSIQIEKIKKLIPSVLCVEMEGAAVAQVCFEYQIPYSIIRTISDKADDNAHIDFPKFASEVASYYALGIIENYLKIKASR